LTSIKVIGDSTLESLTPSVNAPLSALGALYLVCTLTLEFSNVYTNRSK
jgi:hypothetical protein